MALYSDGVKNCRNINVSATVLLLIAVVWMTATIDTRFVALFLSYRGSLDRRNRLFKKKNFFIQDRNLNPGPLPPTPYKHLYLWSKDGLR